MNFRIKVIDKHAERSRIAEAIFSIKTFKKCECGNEIEVDVKDVSELKEFIKLELVEGNFQRVYMLDRITTDMFNIVNKEEFDNLKVDEDQYFYRQLYLCSESINL